MSGWYATPRPPGPAVLRNGVVVWRHGATLGIADSRGVRAIDAGWTIDHHELTADGRWLLARGDAGKRAIVWEVETGRAVRTLVGDAERRESLRASVATIGDAAVVFSASRLRTTLDLLDAVDGRALGWLSTSGMIAFEVERVTAVGGDWLAIHGHGDGEQYDVAVTVAGRQIIEDAELLQTALRERPSVYVWGYQVAIGPADGGRVVSFRDPKWDDDDRPDDPDEALRGFAIWDPATGHILERLPYPGPIDNLATIGADAEQIAVASATDVDVIQRMGGAPRRIAALALDPHRMEVARYEGDAILIEPV